MDLDDIKRGLRAEIKKRENEQYLTFQCNVRQMCKDVLAKLEEQESEIAELKNKINEAQTELELWRDGSIISEANQKELDGKQHSDYKRCLTMARIAQDDWHLHNSLYAMGRKVFEKRKCEFYEKWRKRWLELAERFK